MTTPRCGLPVRPRVSYPRVRRGGDVFPKYRHSTLTVALVERHGRNTSKQAGQAGSALGAYLNLLGRPIGGSAGSAPEKAGRSTRFDDEMSPPRKRRIKESAAPSEFSTHSSAPILSVCIALAAVTVA